MDLTHRVADDQASRFLKTLYQVKYPFTLVIPLAILIMGIISVWFEFGQKWKIGTFSTPVIPFITNAISLVLPAQPTVIATGFVLVSYVLFAISSYQFAVYITGRYLPGVFSALLMLLPFTIIDTNANPRLVFALNGGDGAHVLALTLVPIGLIKFMQYIRTGDKIYLPWLVGTQIGIGLISFFTQFEIILFYLILTISEMLISQSIIKLRRFALIASICIGTILVLYNIFFIRIFLSESGIAMLRVITNVIPLSFFLVPVLGTIAFLIFDRRPQLQPLFIAVSFTIIFYVLKSVGSAFGTNLSVTGDRYEAEFSLGISFLGGIIVMWIFDGIRSGELLKRLPPLKSHKEYIALGFIGLLLAVMSISLLFIGKNI